MRWTIRFLAFSDIYDFRYSDGSLEISFATTVFNKTRVCYSLEASESFERRSGLSSMNKFARDFSRIIPTTDVDPDAEWNTTPYESCRPKRHLYDAIAVSFNPSQL